MIRLFKEATPKAKTIFSEELLILDFGLELLLDLLVLLFEDLALVFVLCDVCLGPLKVLLQAFIDTLLLR